MIVKHSRAWMNKDVPKSGSVHLFADGQANESYMKYGFVVNRPLGCRTSVWELDRI